LVFDYTKHDSMPSDPPKAKPQLRLTGHKREGYGLSWNVMKEGYLASGSEDKIVCVWDINAAVKPGTSPNIGPLFSLNGHEAEVEDVAWNLHHEHFLASVGDDKAIIMWDTRTGKSSAKTENAHSQEINTISFNPFNEYIFSTGGSDRVVNLWDIRNMKSNLHVLSGHLDSIYSVCWNPHNETILASSGTDRRVNVWDLSKIGEEQTQEDAEDGPPELLFIHGGHTAKVSDLSWNPHEPWVLASVAEDNILQIWQMAENIYNENDKDLPKPEDLEK